MPTTKAPWSRLHLGLLRRRTRSTHWPTLDLRRRPTHRSTSTFGYTQSQALVYSHNGEPADVLSLHTYSIPPAHSTNLTLRFLASPINPSDINQIQGVYPTQPPLTSALGTAVPSAVAGNEGVAEVVSTGSAVQHLQPGDWVIPRRPCFGTWRTYATASSEEDLFRLDVDDRPTITPVQAGCVAVNPCTAYKLLRDFVTLDADRGDWFVQNGANSAAGRAAIQFGRLWGLKSINVVRTRAGLEELKRELYKLGATVVVTEEDLLDARSFGEKVAEWTNGGREKIRLGLNCVGGKTATAMARLLADDGCLVTYGAMSRQPVVFPAALAIFRNIRFEGFWLSRWSETERGAVEKKRVVGEILELMSRGEFVVGDVREVRWREGDGDGAGMGSQVDVDRLKREVQGTLQGFRGGKAVFVFQ
ncbi:MAG: mitochondrial 2-enoyl thioester reductase [Peltula sp. TS41687]|nr:MAG: mitochondrial 2-enoyl thioester reductase [Peltula sp. TS41687]